MSNPTQTQTAPVMVELKPSQLIMDKSDVRDILEAHLSITQKALGGKSPDQVYANKLYDFSYNRHTSSDSPSKSMEKLNKLRKDVKLLNLYFDNFIIDELQNQVDHEVSSHESMVESNILNS